MLTRRRMSRGWEKLNNWVTLSIDENNIMNNNTITRHCGNKHKPKGKPKEKSKMPAMNKLWKK
jgi:hypothetical protein